MSRRSLSICWSHLFPLLLASLVALGLALPGSASAATAEPDTGGGVAALTPLEGLLAEDGTLRADSGFRGSVDIRGWRMDTGPDGAPRFSRRESAGVAGGVAASHGTLAAEDTHWDAGFPAIGANSHIYALAVHGDSVYVGGAFDSIGGVGANHIAKWDGERWSTLGSMNSYVWALAVDSLGNLYAGGYFSHAGGGYVGHVAKWNGATWSAMDNGMNSYVYALAVDASDNVYAGGQFTIAGGVTANYIAKWNGADWAPFTVGANNGMQSYVWALALEGGALYAGGYFTHAGGTLVNRVARWTGSAWEALGTGANSTVWALAGDGNGNVYAGGDFSLAGGVTGTGHIARWTGTAWTPVGSGVDAAVRALVVDDGSVYAGGYFGNASSRSVARIARFDRTSGWTALEDGTNGAVRALALGSGDTLYAGGEFTTAGGVFTPAGGGVVNYVSRWDGSNWSPLVVGPGGLNNQVEALAVDGATVYVGGHFTSAGRAEAYRVARWNGVSWSTVGAGMSNGVVYALAVDSDGALYAGGTFTQAGGSSANRVARWNGTGWDPLGSGLNSDVYTLAVDDAGDVYAGGAFTQAGGEPASYIARWDSGESRWFPVGDGTDSHVHALATDGANVYAGGRFGVAGDILVNHVAKWNGSAWSALGLGMNSWVEALVVDASGRLVAGGHFTRAGRVDANRVARWNGSAWSALNTGMNNVVYALVADGDTIYAGGDFSTAGGISTIRIARWDGSGDWRPVGSGVNNRVEALALDGAGIVHAGGSFGTAGAKPSYYFGRWNGLTRTAAADVTSLTYSERDEGTTSDPQTVTLTNGGNGPLAIHGVSIAGADPADFARSGGTCGASLASGASCTIGVTFSPTNIDDRSAILRVTHNALGGRQDVALSGTGLGERVRLSATSLAFGDQLVSVPTRPVTMTLTNRGNAPLTIDSLSLGGTNAGDFERATTCPLSPATLAPRSSCEISLRFTPGARGSRAASLTIVNSADGSPHEVTLAGTGIAPVVSLDPTSVDFGEQNVLTRSAAESVMLANTGDAPLLTSSIVASDEFLRVHDCGSSIAAGESCTIYVAFRPVEIGSRAGTLTITDSAAGSPHVVSLAGTGTVPDIVVGNVTVDEASGNATFTIRLTGVNGQEVSVDYTTSNRTAKAPGDYTTTSGTLVFPPRTRTRQVVVPITGDALDEANETFTLNLSGAVNATIAVPSGVATITDDDPPPALSINDVTVVEGNSGTLNAVFTVSLSTASGQSVRVNYATADGAGRSGAKAPLDYTARSGTLTIAAGRTSGTIAVPIKGDTVRERSETFTVNLLSPLNGTIGDGQGRGTITNND